jgi:uncharacterized membrane protein YfcA
MTDYIIVLLGGFFAGAINSLAGYGSIITLTILMDIVGLSPNVANGTNRVNVMANAFAGSLGYYRQGKMRLNRVWLIVFLVLIGAITGVYVATIISNEGFRNLYRVLIFLLAILILTKPKNWLIKESSQEKLNLWIAFPVFVSIGFYAGLIQAGSGLFMLAALVLLAKKELLEANAIKMFIILFYSVIVIAMFHYKGLIDWKAGAILAVAQAAGSYLTATYASRLPNANLWAYRLLIIIILVIIVREGWMLLGF